MNPMRLILSKQKINKNRLSLKFIHFQPQKKFHLICLFVQFTKINHDLKFLLTKLIMLKKGF